jgi:CheY-like chemotaxis protein
MSAVRLVCWNPDVAQTRSRALREAGFAVDASPLTRELFRQLRTDPPAAVLIDLDRLPSHGREVAVSLRQSKSTRSIPIVLAGGVVEKVARIRGELPDAFFTEWKTVPRVLAKALKSAPVNPVTPPSHMDRYAGSSLIKKLGLKPAMKVALLGASEDFEEKLGDLPEGLVFQSAISKQTGLAIWFVRSRHELDEGAAYVSARLPEGCGLWIVYPKQSGRYRVDFNQNDVRRTSLAVDLVDYKVCAVDSDWSGIKFARKKK